jgi:hypothetical protein
MRINLQLAVDFGTLLADGTRAAEYREGRIDPYVDICSEIILDFSGIRSANSSFINALVSGAVERHGAKVLDILNFKGCNPVLRVLVESAIDLGLSKTDALCAA